LLSRKKRLNWARFCAYSDEKSCPKPQDETLFSRLRSEKGRLFGLRIEQGEGVKLASAAASMPSPPFFLSEGTITTLDHCNKLLAQNMCGYHAWQKHVQPLIRYKSPIRKRGNTSPENLKRQSTIE
jgi:hypothetical protein